MARANLQVDHELAESFRNAQNADSDVRCMKVVIQGESLILEETLAKIADSGTDFNSMLSRSVQSANACMLLYNLSDESESVFNSGSLNLGSKAKEWCLICWIPDTCPVRDKMLYSSSREDIKKTLGRALFVKEYSPTEQSDLTWAAYNGDSTVDKAIYESEKERIIKEETTASHEESGATKSSTMALLPFNLASDVTAAVTTLLSNNESISVLEVYVHDEVVSLTSDSAPTEEGKGNGAQEAAIGSITSFSSYIHAEHGRFYIIKIPSGSENSTLLTGTFFLFSCPESTPVRSRMTMSSCKATVVYKLTEAGLDFTKIFEVREPSDIDEYMNVATKAADVKVEHVRPTARGRAGTRKVNKFVPDA
jgi:twinfilin